MSADADQPLLDLELPASFDRAPDWARELAQQQRRDRHHLSGALTDLQGDVRSLQGKLGKEPNSDGKGGEGLIGDVRKMNRDIGQLMDLKKMGMGAAVAIAFFGALIILGAVHWVQSITGSGK